MVSAPGGIAMDNYYVYWSNKLEPTQHGTIVRAPHDPNAAPEKLEEAITDKSYGVCTAVNNVFFTAESKSLYGINRNGGGSVKVSSEFGEARGCAWDGANTVYVADRKNNKVYSFPAWRRYLYVADPTLTKLVYYVLNPENE